MSDMGGLGDILGSILENPEAMSKLREQAEAMGLGDILPPDGATSGDSGEFFGFGESSAQPSCGSSQNGRSDDDLAGILVNLLPLIEGLNKDDDASRMLHSLSPFINEQRRKKLGEAERIMKLVRLLEFMPNLKKII